MSTTAPTVVSLHASTVLCCTYLGIVHLPSGPGAKKVTLEVYRHPITGECFALDAARIREHGQRITDFAGRQPGGILDLSDEPRDRLPAVLTCRFLQA